MTTRKTITQHWLTAAATAVVLLGSGAAASAQEVKVTYMKIPPLVPLLHAERAGLFKKEGLDVKIQVVNGEPPMMSAIVAGSSHIGMTGVGGVVLAHAAGQPVQVFGTADLESASDIQTWITANKAKGISSVKDLRGKTVGIVAPNTQAEMTVRDFLMANGLSASDVKMVAVPFPQMPAALEVGNIDAAMTGEPFHSAMHASKKIEAVDVAKGSVADYGKVGAMALGGWFARKDWLAANPATATKFLRALMAANKELTANRKLVDAIFEKDFGMPPEVASRIPLPLNTTSLEAQAKDYAAMIEAMHRTGLSKRTYPATDLVVNVKY